MSAKQYLASDLEVEKAGVGRRVIRFVIGAIAEVVTHDVETGVEVASSDRAFVVIRDRWSGGLVHELAYGPDLAAADLGKKTVDADLDRLEIDEFLHEYGIDWTPPEVAPREGN